MTFGMTQMLVSPYGNGDIFHILTYINTCIGAISFPPGIFFSSNNIILVIISYINCSGFESKVLDCPYELATTNDAAVICQC